MGQEYAVHPITVGHWKKELQERKKAMFTKNLIRSIIAVTVLALGFGAQAQATSYTLDLTGSVASANINSYNYGVTHYDDWNLSLDGLTTPITVYQGDVINATITLDNSVTIPASVSNTWLYLGLYGNNSSGFDTTTKATTTFFNGSIAGISQTDTEIYSSDWLPAGAVLFPPDNTAVTFDKVTIDFIISKIGAGGANSLDLSGATFYTQRQSPSAPVPIPAAAWLLGSGLVGLFGIRKKIRS